MENILSYIIAPILSGVAGWFVAAYRNKQKKETDQIEVAKQYKELLIDALEDKRNQYQEIDKLREELREVKEEIIAVKEERSAMKATISRASKCSFSQKCPVIKDYV